MPATTGLPCATVLEQALERPARAPGASLGSWRWTVRQRMAAVRDALIDETDHPEDGWLAARGGAAPRAQHAARPADRAGPAGAREPRGRAGPDRPEAAGRRHRPPHPAAARPRVRRGRARAGRLRVGRSPAQATSYTRPRCSAACGRHGGVPEWPIGTALKAVAGRDVSRGFESRPLCSSTDDAQSSGLGTLRLRAARRAGLLGPARPRRPRGAGERAGRRGSRPSRDQSPTTSAVRHRRGASVRVIAGLSSALATGAVAATPNAHTHQPWRRRARMWQPQASAGMPSTRLDRAREGAEVVAAPADAVEAATRPGRGCRSAAAARRTPA